jgi:hypothetical protein
VLLSAAAPVTKPWVSHREALLLQAGWEPRLLLLPTFRPPRPSDGAAGTHLGASTCDLVLAADNRGRLAGLSSAPLSEPPGSSARSWHKVCLLAIYLVNKWTFRPAALLAPTHDYHCSL